MRSFQQVVVLLFALLFAFALAQDAEPSYDATVYITSTITRVNTITLSGSHTASLANSTSTIPASHITSAPNSTVAAPTSTAPTTTAQFTGAASHLNANALLAAVAAGVGYLVL